MFPDCRCSCTPDESCITSGSGQGEDRLFFALDIIISPSCFLFLRRLGFSELWSSVCRNNIYFFQINVLQVSTKQLRERTSTATVKADLEGELATCLHVSGLLFRPFSSFSFCLDPLNWRPERGNSVNVCSKSIRTVSAHHVFSGNVLIFQCQLCVTCLSGSFKVLRLLLGG